MSHHLTPRGMQDLVRGSISLLVGVLILVAVGSGWLGGPNSFIVKLALGGAIIANIAGTVFFLRYLMRVWRDLRDRG